MASPSIARAEPTHPRAWAKVALIVLILALVVIPHLIWRVFNRHSPFARLFLKGAGWAAGARLTIKGQPINRNVLYLANHLSWIDILVLAGKTGSAFVAKADMESWPVLGWLADQNNTVYVKRDKGLDSHNQASSLQKALLTGQPVALFPEGTTAGGRELLPFRSSLLAAVVPAPEGVSIQPVAIDYGDLADDIAWTDDESVGNNALRIMGRYPRIPITIHFLEPLDHADFGDRKAIAAHSRAEIAEALGQVALREERLF
jgi:1-acyl-sn-glycerol-3-phosphate acyltransferase